MVFFTLFCWTRRHFRKSDKIGLFITKLPHQISRRIMRMKPGLNGVTHTWNVSIWFIRYVEAFMEGKALQGTTRRHLSRQTINNWIKKGQLDVTCFIISLFNAQHVSDVNTSILKSLRLISWVISCVVLLWFDVCWCYVVVWLGCCGIRVRAESHRIEYLCRAPQIHRSSECNQQYSHSYIIHFTSGCSQARKVIRCINYLVKE